MTSRSTIPKAQALTKSEYAHVKHIPTAVPLKKITPEGDKSSEPLEPTPKLGRRQVKVDTRGSPEQMKRAGQRYSTSEDDTYLNGELSRYNDKVTTQDREIERLRIEVSRLQEDKVQLTRQYEQRLSSTQNQDLSRYELERQIKQLQSENKRLEDELNRSRLSHSNHDLNSRIQIDLEQELRQRADERAKLISEYELKIHNLQNELALQRNSKDGDNPRQAIGRLEAENYYLLEETKSLKNQRRELETQIDKLRVERYSVDDGTRQRLLETELSSRNTATLLERTRLYAERSDMEKVLLMIEVERLRDELIKVRLDAGERASRGYEYNNDTREPREPKEARKRAGVNAPDEVSRGPDYEKRNILFMIEIERLGMIVAELQAENEIWRQQVIDAEENASQQMSEFKRQYEQIIRPQIETQIRNATGSLEAEKKNLEQQNKAYKTKIEDLEHSINFLQGELGKLQQKNGELLLQSDELQRKSAQLEAGHESLRYTVEGELRVKLEQEKLELSKNWIQERGHLLDELNQTKNKLSELESKLILASSENEHLHHAAQGREQEIEGLRKRLIEADQEQKRQLDQLREVLEVTFKQRLEIEIQGRTQQMELQKSAVERDLHQLQERVANYEEQIKYLGQDNLKLRQENTEKQNAINELNVKLIHWDEREKEIEAWKNRYNELLLTHNQDLEHLRAEYDQKFTMHMEFELKKAQDNMAVEKTVLESQLKEIMHLKEELENKLILLSTEIDRITLLLNEKTRERDELAKRALELERELERIKATVEVQVRQTLETETRESNMRFMQEKNNLEGQLIMLREEHGNLKMKLVLFMTEIERLHTIIFEKEKEGDTWRERMAEMETQHFNKIQEIKKQVEDVIRDKLTQEIQNVTVQWQEEKRALESELNFLRSLNKELHDTMGSRPAEDSNALRSQLALRESELENMRQRLNQINVDQNKQVDEIRMRVHANLTVEFENQIKDLTNRFNSERIALEDQIRQLKNRISEMEYQLKQAQEQNDPMNYKNQVHQPEAERAKRSALPVNVDVGDSPEKQRRIEIESRYQILQQMNEGYQRDLMLLSTELERMAQINMELKSQIDQAKAQAQAQVQVQPLGSSRVNQVELDQMRMEIEAHYRNEKENLVKELHMRFTTEIQAYEVQIRELRQKVIENESGGFMAKDEIRRLQALITDKNNEIEVWKGKLNMIEKMKEQEVQEVRHKYEFEYRSSIEHELKGITEQFNFERSQYEKKIQDLKQRIDEYENKFIYLSVENDRLNALYEDKLKEIETWKRRYTNLEQVNFSDFEEVKVQVESLRRSSVALSDYEIRFQAERTTYEAQILQYKHKISELEVIITDINKENQRLSTLYFQKNAEAESMKRKSSYDPVNLEELAQLQKENEELKKLITENHELKIRSEVDRSNYQSHISQLKQVIEANQTEMAKLADLLELRKAENQTLYRDLEKVREETNKKLRNYKELEAEYAMLSSRYKNIHQEIDDLQNARDTYKSQLEKNEVELAEKNRELLQRIHQIDALKDKYEQAIANVDPITSTIITRLSTNTREASKSIWQV